MYYEVLWFVESVFNRYEAKTFKRQDAAMRFYEKHKNDEDKCHWWVTKRDDDGWVLDTLVI